MKPHTPDKRRSSFPVSTGTDRMKEMTIGVLARSAGVNIETIRYYQRRGLIDTPRKPPGGVRRYEANSLAQLRFIKRAQQLGFNLREIRDLLTLGQQSCDATRHIAEHRLADIEARLADLKTMRRLLARLIRECTAGRHAACPIVQSLSGTQDN
jgi:MerR family transcriptional regulator, mercuric resistance operon regulatory protein